MSKSDIVNNFDKKVKMAEGNVLDELEDREARRNNLVFHGVGECPADAAAGAERIIKFFLSCKIICTKRDNIPAHLQ